MVILVMITVNLGQLSIYKTDVDNAADAGALAGASLLTGTLLGLGLQSESMFGYALIMIMWIIILFCFEQWEEGIACCIAYRITMLTETMMAFENGNMGWSNAKKTALQYAFNNAGIDEPRPTFEDFLIKSGIATDPDSLSPSEVAFYYDEYAKGESDRARDYGQNGFSRFMLYEHNGYAASVGDIRPGNISDAKVTSGYGWNVYEEDGKIKSKNSYDNGGSYKNYENWVEVEVIGSSTYALTHYTMIWSNIASLMRDFVEENAEWPEWLEWLFDNVISFIFELIEFVMAFINPMGVMFEDEDGQTTDNPILVKVKRFKRDKDLGLWNFRYGTVSAGAVGHAFREDNNGCLSTIQPTSDPFAAFQNMIEQWENGNMDWNFNMFDSQCHLFESELESTWRIAP
jgi:hypothetical protein